MTNWHDMMLLVSEWSLKSPLHNTTIASVLRALIGSLFHKFGFFMDCLCMSLTWSGFMEAVRTPASSRPLLGFNSSRGTISIKKSNWSNFVIAMAISFRWKWTINSMNSVILHIKDTDAVINIQMDTISHFCHKQTTTDHYCFRYKMNFIVTE